MNLPIMQDFVSPTLCIDLVLAGLNLKTPFQYRVVNNTATLDSNCFDTDNYYEDGRKYLQLIRPATFIPAFQIVDMEKLLPDYLLGRVNNHFILRCDDMFKLDEEQNERIPDAFAMMVLQGFRKRILQADYCIKILTAQ